LENEIVRKYGLKNKTEIWKAGFLVRNMRAHSMELRAKLRYADKQAQKEANEIIAKYAKLGIVPAGSTLDNLLEVSVEDVLTRRLQTQVYLKGMANTMKQARQLIIHGHIMIKGKIIRVPGYLVPKTEEETIAFAPSSALSNPEHPMRPKEGFQPKLEPIKLDEGKEKKLGAPKLRDIKVAEEIAVEITPPTAIDSISAIEAEETTPTKGKKNPDDVKKDGKSKIHEAKERKETKGDEK